MEDFVECVHDMIDEIRDSIETMELNYPKIPEYVNPIINSDNFIDKLKMEGLCNDKIESFIDTYLRYYND